jgi:DNA-binding transcriptional LysR family regulator
MRMDIELRLLRHALALAEHRRFGTAAQVLGISQPALTRSIQQLERRTGTALFVRSRAGVTPTDAGELLLAGARRVVGQAEDLSRSLDALGGNAPEEVRLGAGPYPVEMIVGPALARLTGAHPEASVSVTVGQFSDLVEQVRGRQLDLAVCESSLVPPQAGLEVLPLARHPGLLVARAGHPLAGRRRVRLEQALAWPLALSGRLPPRVLAPLAEARSRARPDLPARARFPELECPLVPLMKALVAGSDALALLPPLSVRDEVERGELAVLRCREPWMHTQFAVVRREDRAPGRAAATLARLLQQEDAALARREEPVLRCLLG